MRKLIATLKVYASDDPNEATNLDYGKQPDFELTINTDSKGDSAVFADVVAKLGRDEVVKAAVAHELGHFLAYILGDPSHKKFLASMGLPGFLRDMLETPLIYPGEQKAWEFANQMAKLDPLVEQTALASYERNGYRTVAEMYGSSF